MYLELTYSNRRFLFAFALVLIKHYLTHTYALWCYFNILVFLYVFQCFFKRENNFRSQCHSSIATACTHVGKLLCFANIYNQVIRANMFANDLSTINFFSRCNKEFTPVL